jgi:RHS repeat-associated protein
VVPREERRERPVLRGQSAGDPCLSSVNQARTFTDNDGGVTTLTRPSGPLELRMCVPVRRRRCPRHPRCRASRAPPARFRPIGSDARTGLLVNRYYDPGRGQFLSVDPLVDETDQPYVYTGGDPVSDTDPSGLDDGDDGDGDASTPLIEELAARALAVARDAALGADDPIGKAAAEIPTGDPATGENLPLDTSTSVDLEIESGAADEVCPLAEGSTDEAARVQEAAEGEGIHGPFRHATRYVDSQTVVDDGEIDRQDD